MSYAETMPEPYGATVAVPLPLLGGPLDGDALPPDAAPAVTVRTCVKGFERFHLYHRSGITYRFAGTALVPHEHAVRHDTVVRAFKLVGEEMTVLSLQPTQ